MKTETNLLTKLAEMQNAIHVHWSGKIQDEVIAELNKFPENAVIFAIDDFINKPRRFSFDALYDIAKKVMRQDRNYNPANQWALVLDRFASGCCTYLTMEHKFLFDNIRTNLAIELMGGQKYFLNHYSKEHEYDLREEFIEKFDKAVILPELNLHSFIFITPFDFNSKPLERIAQDKKVGFTVLGYHEDKVITDDEADLLFADAVKTGRELLDLSNHEQTQKEPLERN